MALALILALVVLATADEPEVGVHCLLAVGEVLLCEEVELVLGDLGQVFLTRRYHRTDSLETLADGYLFRSERRVTGDRTESAEIEARAVMTVGCCLAMGSEHHFLVGCMLGFFVDFGESTADGFDCVSIFYFCHSLLAMDKENKPKKQFLSKSVTL